MASATTGRHISTSRPSGTARRVVSPATGAAGSSAGIARCRRFVRLRDSFRALREFVGETLEARAQFVEPIGLLGRGFDARRTVEAADERFKPVEARFRCVEAVIEVLVQIREAAIEVV